MIISKRLETIVGMIESCSVLGDICCDHAYVSIRALQEKKTGHVIAADVAKGPLETAVRNCREAGVEDSAEFVLSDGLSGLADGCGIECAVIAGMGGILMSRILREAEPARFQHLQQLILGPQSDQDLVRKTLLETGIFTIRSEKWVFDEGKYYVLLDVRRSLPGTPQENYSEAQLHYGRHCDPACTDVYLNYLNSRKEALCAALESLKKGSPDKNAVKSDGLKKRIELVEEAILQNRREGYDRSFLQE